MTKQAWTLVVLAVVLGALYIFRFTDLGRTRQIQINVSSRPFAPNAAPDDILPVMFGLDREWRLTALRVTPLTEVSNAQPKRVWNLVSKAKTGSEPLLGFVYGHDVAGMQQFGGVPPSRLQPGTAYRLEIEAPRARGSVNFTPQAAGGTPR